MAAVTGAVVATGGKALISSATAKTVATSAAKAAASGAAYAGASYAAKKAIHGAKGASNVKKEVTGKMNEEKVVKKGNTEKKDKVPLFRINLYLRRDLNIDNNHRAVREKPKKYDNSNNKRYKRGGKKR